MPKPNLWERSYESLLQAGEQLERNALEIKAVAQKELGIVTEPTATLELTEDELIYLSDYLNTEFGTSEVADDLRGKVRQALAIETQSGGIWAQEYGRDEKDRALDAEREASDRRTEEELRRQERP